MIFPTPIGFFGGAAVKVIDILNKLDLTTDLELCLDFGDGASYAGGGQSWDDVSGNAVDFHFGADAGASTDDPAANGSVGGLSDAEYSSVDGGDFHKAKSNPASFQPFHKSNATFTLYTVYWPNGSGTHRIIGNTAGTGTDTGIRWGAGGGLNLGLSVRDAGANVVGGNSGANMNSGAWNHAGLIVDAAAGAGGSDNWMNGASTTFDGTYTSPATGNSNGILALYTLGIGSGDPGLSKSGDRMAIFIAWSKVLTAANLTAIQNEIEKVRYT